LAATVGAIAVLVQVEAFASLVPVVLTVGAGLATFFGCGVLWLNFTRPQNLMLGQISGTEYVAIETKAILGDSERGERTVIAEPSPSASRELMGAAQASAAELQAEDELPGEASQP